jgi:hypothetical protein
MLKSLFTFIFLLLFANIQAQKFKKEIARQDIRIAIKYSKYTEARDKLEKLHADGLSRDALKLIQDQLIRAGKENNHFEFHYFLDKTAQEFQASLIEFDEIEELNAFELFFDSLIPTLSSPSTDFALLFCLESGIKLTYYANGKEYFAQKQLEYSINTIYSNKSTLLFIPTDEIFYYQSSKAILNEPSLFDYFSYKLNHFFIANEQASPEYTIDSTWFEPIFSKKLYTYCVVPHKCDNAYLQGLDYLLEMEKHYYTLGRFETAGRYAIIRLKSIINENKSSKLISNDLQTKDQQENRLLIALRKNSEAYTKTAGSQVFSYEIAKILFAQSARFDPKDKPEVKFLAVEALAIVDSALKSSTMFFSAELKALQQNIIEAKFAVNFDNLKLDETHNCEINSRNVKKLYFKLVKFADEQAITSGQFELISEQVVNLLDSFYLYNTVNVKFKSVSKPGHYAYLVFEEDYKLAS